VAKFYVIKVSAARRRDILNTRRDSFETYYIIEKKKSELFRLISRIRSFPTEYGAK